MKANLVYHDKSTILGEGPVWNHLSRELVWLDVLGSKIHQYDPIKNTYKKNAIGDMISCMAPIDAKRYVMAYRNGFGFINLESGRISIIEETELGISHNRFNDGKCGPAGNFWAGSMNMNERESTGAFYRLNAQLEVQRQFDEVFISNGLSWSGDGSQMYYIDTLRFEILVFDFDLPTGTIGNKRSLMKIEPGNIGLDGMTIDANDNLWVAVYGAGAVWCIDGNSGKKLSEISVDAEKTSSCTFGGDELDTLFITTIAERAHKEDINAGALFSAKPGVKGRRADLFKGNVVSR